jgi:radical SAM protein with 4Fe4S-binding SPASM domain
MKSNRIVTQAIMVVGKDTVYKMFENYKFLQSLGFASVKTLFDTDHGVDSGFLEVLDKNLTKIIRNTTPPAFIKDRIINELKNPSNKENACFTPTRNVSIAPNGGLYFCHELVPKMEDDKGKDSYGNIIDGYVNTNLYYNKMLYRCTFSKFKNNKDCENCPAAFWCKGGCIASHFHSNGNYEDLNKDLCKINIKLTEVVRREIGA